MLLLACFLAAAAAAPATYDQRQDGDFNVRADVQNVVLVVAVPQRMSIPPGFFDGFLKNSKQHGLQDRSDVHVMEAFVEPNTPYHVEIGGGSDRNADGDGRAVEVVIAGRRRLESGAQDETEDEIKLIGAREQCGPEHERDPVTLMCQARSQPVPEIKHSEPEIEHSEPKTSPSPAQPANLQELATEKVPQVVPASA